MINHLREAQQGTTTFFNKYFGSARFKRRSYYGGYFGTNNDNSYELFSAGNIDFLVISFEYDPSTTNFTRIGGALDWGENLIKNHPNHNVIVLSHYVLKADGSFSVQGRNIYQRFKVYPNFKFISGAHVVDSAEAMRKDTYNGNTVYTVLSNYQGRENGGNGRLRIYEFHKLSIDAPKDAFTIYPNPNSTNKLTLYFTKEIKGKANLQIFSTTGNLLLQKTFTNINNPLSIEHNLPTGNYMVVIQTESGRFERKFAVIR